MNKWQNVEKCTCCTYSIKNFDSSAMLLDFESFWRVLKKVTKKIDVCIELTCRQDFFREKVRPWTTLGLPPISVVYLDNLLFDWRILYHWKWPFSKEKPCSLQKQEVFGWNSQQPTTLSWNENSLNSPQNSSIFSFVIFFFC